MDKETMEMISKMLDSKLIDLEKTVGSKLGSLDSKLVAFDSKLCALDSKLSNNTLLLVDLTTEVNKNTLELESINNKLEIMAEVQKSHMKQDENVHNDIVKTFSEKIEVIELAMKDTSEDIKDIIYDIKHVSNEVEDISEKIEYIGMKEFNNERDLFMMKKKLSQ